MIKVSFHRVKVSQVVGIVIGFILLPALPVFALPPTAANDGTRTIVTPSNNTFNVTGGTLSGDRSNLFHSFSQFNLEQNQVANFISQPGVNNILGRVVSGNPSVINGLIQVTNGNSNLFLINPAGVIFGQNASLNVPANFTATNATAIGFGNNNWWTISGNNDYTNLNGNPNNFAFSPLGIVSSNSLIVSSSQNFSLVREPATNGSLGIVGRVDRVFRLSRPGNILNLEINAVDLCQQVGGCINGTLPDNWSLPAVEIPRLLTMGTENLNTGTLGKPSLPNSGQLSDRLPGQNPQNLAAPRVPLTGNSGSLPNSQTGQLGNLSNFLSSNNGGINGRINLPQPLLSNNLAINPVLPSNLAPIRNGQLGGNLGIGNLGGTSPLNSGVPSLGIRGGAETVRPPGGGAFVPRNGILPGEISDGSPGTSNNLGRPNNPIRPNDPNNPDNAPEQPRTPRGVTLPIPQALALGNPAQNLSLAVVAREARLTNQFSNFLGRPSAGANLSAIAPQREINPLEIQQILQNNQAQTNVKSGVVYLNFASQAEGIESGDDALELVLLTPEGNALRQTIPGATRSKVLSTALNFRGKITNRNRSNRNFLTEAQQLYTWFIAPLEEHLQASGVNNLVLITDDGLRSLPMAALHDGQGFLIERYSITLVPTLTLTDLSYRDIRRSQILAMGASRFTDQEPLPAVPLELQEVIGQLQGQSFLNENFTLDNLRRQRQQQPFQIIHLATHAVFAPGDQSNSYIQLWDSRLALDQLKQLRWNDPPVDLLVLSACDTAIGDQQAELGFAGLAIQAGVKSALASLWSVSDEGTLGLMREFYYQLGKAPIKAEALRQAQLALLRGEVRINNGNLITPHGQVALPPELAKLGNINLDHPYFWSAFTLIGSPW